MPKVFELLIENHFCVIKSSSLFFSHETRKNEPENINKPAGNETI